MPNYIPKAEQIDVLNEKLTAINDTLKKKNDFTDAVKNLKDVTTKAEEATEKATAAAESVVSPSAKVTKSGDTTTITITDKSGTTSAEVVDGSDAEVTKDNVVAALGYEPAEKEGNYELIETITLTEDTSSIVRTAEPDGTTYNFERCKVLFRTPFKSSGFVNVFFEDTDDVNTRRSYLRLNDSSASGRIAYSAAEAYKCCGTWKIRNHEYLVGYSTLNASNTCNIQETGPSFYEMIPVENKETIQYLKIIGNASWSMPSGTKITIYGIRA